MSLIRDVSGVPFSFCQTSKRPCVKVELKCVAACLPYAHVVELAR